MPILAAILLGMLALAFVLYPLYQRTSAIKRSAVSLPLAVSQQTDREQAARSALQEVEFDFQLGNLAEADYRSLRERYMHRALSALKSRHDREQELDEAIEEELRKLREEDQNAGA